MQFKYPWQQQQDERREERRANPPKTKVQRKMEFEERVYSILRKDYLADHPVCQCGMIGCEGVATEIHHKKGRGRFFLIVEFFLAVCCKCHRWIEANPEEAKALGYSLNRQTK